MKNIDPTCDSQEDGLQWVVWWFSVIRAQVQSRVVLFNVANYHRVPANASTATYCIHCRSDFRHLRTKITSDLV